jgi:hypothetical protein
MLTAANMGPDATERDFDAWWEYVLGHIDQAFTPRSGTTRIVLEVSAEVLSFDQERLPEVEAKLQALSSSPDLRVCAVRSGSVVTMRDRTICVRQFNFRNEEGDRITGGTEEETDSIGKWLRTTGWTAFCAQHSFKE